MKFLRKVPPYVWTFTALILGIVAGGLLPGQLGFISRGTATFIQVFIKFVPILILAALSPAVATLVKRGLAGKFAGAVIGWEVFTSTVAGLFGLAISSFLFKVPFSLKTADSGGALAEASQMLKAIGQQHSASLPLLAIVLAVVIGVIAVWIPALYRFLGRVEEGIKGMGTKIGYVIIPLILCLGVSIGVRFGARVGMGHYLTMTLYTLFLCLVWFAFYVFVILKLFAKIPVVRMLKEYYLPTAVFAAATCSSMATLPVNLASARKYGIRDEVADFIIPFGSVVQMNASTLAYVAYAPFILTYIYGIEISWTLLLIAWPAMVLFTIAAPGLPAGMGTALWSSTLFASMLGIEEPMKSTFITTWIALSGGIPDMFRTTTNCTACGFTAILFDKFFHKFSKEDLKHID
ncbi:cation:dicarboxylase symporter family transporter [bacterium]|nr:cation:dicarboxylase symporter family transporter [bacterium]